MHLVTGATGHIGNVLIRQLLEQGEHVRALVRQGTSPLALIDLDVELVPGDLLDPISLAQAVQGVEHVYHLGAKITLSRRSDPETGHVNLDGTRNLLAACFDAKVSRFIYASSLYALRLPKTGIVDETFPFDPFTSFGEYDQSKAAASLLVQQAVREGMDAVILCPTAVVGSFDFRCSETGRGILYHLKPGIKFTVDGAYDFVDVRDVALGFIQAAQNGRRGEVYILGGDRLTVQQVSKIIWQFSGGWHKGFHLPDWVADLAAGILPLFTSDPLVTAYALGAIRSNSFISHAKATQELDYHPRPARQAIEDAVHWWQKRLLGCSNSRQSPWLIKKVPD